VREEDQIQKAIFQHLETRSAPDVFAFAVPNGGFRRPIEAKILKGLGVKSGVPDLIIVKSGATYALELKTKTGKLSENQIIVIDAMAKAGAVTGVAYGLDAAIGWLEERGILRGKAA
jgi:hypothetical protein